MLELGLSFRHESWGSPQGLRVSRDLVREFKDVKYGVLEFWPRLRTLAGQANQARSELRSHEDESESG